MICDNCHNNSANVHLTKIINNKKIEIHLCEECAHDNPEMMGGYPFSINNFLAGLLDISGYPFKSDKENSENEYKCNVCGLTYEEFRNGGKFGCANCYNVFGDRLTSLFKRIHGNTHHSGKIPKRTWGAIKVKKDIDKLKAQLILAISNEEYEKAAELRDKIREIEAKNNR